MTAPRAHAISPDVLPFPQAAATEVPPLRALTSGLAHGDDDAWTKFHRNYGPAIFHQLLAATRGDHALASDALQQTYLRVARHARPCDSEAMFTAWLRVVARSALNDCLRRRRSFWSLLHRHHADPGAARDQSPLNPANEAENENLTAAALDAALAEIDPADRALLEAKYFTGTDVRTLAGQLAISPKAAESRLTRARTQLRERLLAHLSRHDQEI